MVDAAHPGPRARAPGDAVVERARTEHRDDRAGEDRGCDAAAAAFGVRDEQRADHERDHERALMERPAKERLRAGGHHGWILAGFAGFGHKLRRAYTSGNEPTARPACVRRGPRPDGRAAPRARSGRPADARGVHRADVGGVSRAHAKTSLRSSRATCRRSRGTAVAPAVRDFCFALFGSTEREGRIRVGRRIVGLAAFGNIDLDLREATFERDVITIVVVAFLRHRRLRAGGRRGRRARARRLRPQGLERERSAAGRRHAARARVRVRRLRGHRRLARAGGVGAEKLGQVIRGIESGEHKQLHT